MLTREPSGEKTTARIVLVCGFSCAGRRKAALAVKRKAAARMHRQADSRRHERIITSSLSVTAKRMKPTFQTVPPAVWLTRPDLPAPHPAQERACLYITTTRQQPTRCEPAAAQRAALRVTCTVNRARRAERLTSGCMNFAIDHRCARSHGWAPAPAASARAGTADVPAATGTDVTARARSAPKDSAASKAAATDMASLSTCICTGAAGSACAAGSAMGSVGTAGLLRARPRGKIAHRHRLCQKPIASPTT
jgi:hypothetical protein